MFPDPFAMETRASCERQQRHAEAERERRLAFLPPRPFPLVVWRERVDSLRRTGRRAMAWLARIGVWGTRDLTWIHHRVGTQEIE